MKYQQFFIKKETNRFSYILNIAFEAVLANKFRSMLTALGIIFGVAAVIAMMAIGNGAQQEILEQIKLVGVNNIIISPKVEKKGDNKQNSESTDNQEGLNNSKKKYSPGLTIKDAESIKAILPTVKLVSPEVIYETSIIQDGKSSNAKISGVTPDYFKVFNLEIAQGEMFNQEQLIEGKQVCIIGQVIKSKLFAKEDPIGKYIKCDNIWFKVIGVIQAKNVTQSASENLGISEYNEFIYTPLQTLLLRYKDRSLINAAILRSDENGEDDESHNQIDKITIQVDDSKNVKATTEILTQMMKRRHAGVEDYEIKVPELLLKQEQKTKDIFNIVLGAIASISLIVGGIGIMNIMLASVMERIREIGVRLALGATKRDVIAQFLSEATMISLSGGIVGIMLGIVLAKIITKVAGILTIISPLSIIVSFFVSATVGILFGYMPARKAAMQDPVSSLRHE
ncbi:MAG: ABC transporter permease [Bacteroidetes bacterium]|nr:ABC transporter permease [Bacteroidota bacterium]